MLSVYPTKVHFQSCVEVHLDDYSPPSIQPSPYRSKEAQTTLSPAHSRDLKSFPGQLGDLVPPEGPGKFNLTISF